MNNDDRLAWLAHEATADLNLSDARCQEFADLLKVIAGELGQGAAELRGEVEKLMPSEPEERDEAGWWKERKEL
jgi:hypothetical protein